MTAIRSVLLLCLIGFSQSLSIPEKSHFLNSVIEKVNSAGTTWKAGHNFHPSVSQAALKALCGARFDDSIMAKYDRPHIDHNVGNIKASDIPSTFDARKHWKQCPHIGHVHDQGHCGSCWAVAITAAVSDRMCVASNGKFKSMLSSDDLLTCCNECGYGCNGACPCGVYYHLTRRGLVTGGDHGTSSGCKPYSLEPCEHHINGSLPTCTDTPVISTPICHFKCSNRKFPTSYWKDSHHKIKDYYHVNATVEAIQKEILANGPVQTAFRVYEDFFAYKSGIYRHVVGKAVGGHAVKIIGWGEENDTPYWLVVNSWNRHWGENGYFRMIRGTNDCNFESGIFGTISDLSNLTNENDAEKND